MQLSCKNEARDGFQIRSKCYLARLPPAPTAFFFLIFPALLPGRGWEPCLVQLQYSWDRKGSAQQWLCPHCTPRQPLMQHQWVLRAKRWLHGAGWCLRALVQLCGAAVKGLNASGRGGGNALGWQHPFLPGWLEAPWWHWSPLQVSQLELSGSQFWKPFPKRMGKVACVWAHARRCRDRSFRICGFRIVCFFGRWHPPAHLWVGGTAGEEPAASGWDLGCQ